ncbi:hypothetical protein [Reinekea sp.]|jgi:uncharacterized protein YjiS (DUF1127 family)|uniref:hypothetical protein n=1 Tax=Reinekea sp. TaxID=1970455 RepID=UPI003989DED8
MTTQDQVRFTNTKSEPISLDLSFFASFKRTLSLLKKNLEDKRAYQNMAQLPDYMLKDMGVGRNEIQTKLENPWWNIK